MGQTIERGLALFVTLVNGFLGAWLGTFSQSQLREAVWAILFSLPGLAVIWFRKSLHDSELAFPRGIRRESPPALLALVGWFFLLVIPMFYIYSLSARY